jgi:signal transduction histidine kinase
MSDEPDPEVVLERMSDGFFAVDPEWRITHTNERGRRFLAAGEPQSTDEIDRQRLWTVLPDPVGETFRERLRAAMEAESREPVSFEAYYEPLDAWFGVRAYPAESGLSVYLHETTDRHRRGDTLEARERVLREMYEIVADRESTFTEQVETLLELGREELDTAYGTLSRIEGDDYVFEVVSADDDSIESGDVVPLSATNCEIAASREQTLVLGDVARDAPEETDRAGYTEWGIACYVGAPVFVDDDVYGTFCFYDTEARADQFSDWGVTLVDLMSRWVSYELQRQRANARLQQQNEKLERFASVVSHDLRNPLEVLRGSLELAERTGETSHFERCRNSIERMETLIDSLLTMARAGATIDAVETVALGELANRSWQTVATADATLAVETDATIRAEESRLRQLLENLFRNSVEHGSTAHRSQARGDSVEHGSTGSRPQAGDSVERSPTDSRTKSGDTAEPDSGVTITVGDLPDGFSVEDDGPGIAPDEREHVFEGGYSTKANGTGFGLAIVDEIADAHGWEVTVTDGVDGGARFEITGVDIVARNTV